MTPSPFPLDSAGQLAQLILEDPPGKPRPIVWSGPGAKKRFEGGIAHRRPQLFLFWVCDQKAYFFDEYAALVIGDVLANIANGGDFVYDATCMLFQQLGLKPKANGLKPEFHKVAQRSAPSIHLAAFLREHFN